MPKHRLRTQGLNRALSNRQIQLLSMGGVIGVGLFYGSGVALQLAGPSILLDYAVGGLIVMIMMRALGEMTVEDPLAGSFIRHAERALGPMAGFITGGMWWFFWVSTVMSELSAIGLLIQYWFPHFPPWIPGLIALALFTAANLTTVAVFGKSSFGLLCSKFSRLRPLSSSDWALRSSPYAEAVTIRQDSRICGSITDFFLKELAACCKPSRWSSWATVG